MLFLFNSQITSVSMVTKELAKTQRKTNNLKTTLINQWQQQKTSFSSQNRRTPQQKNPKTDREQTHLRWNS